MAIQITTIDWKYTQDFTATTSFCCNCNNMLNLSVEDSNTANVVLYKKCPFCGEIFTEHLIKEEK